LSNAVKLLRSLSMICANSLHPILSRRYSSYEFTAWDAAVTKSSYSSFSVFFIGIFLTNLKSVCTIFYFFLLFFVVLELRLFL